MSQGQPIYRPPRFQGQRDEDAGEEAREGSAMRVWGDQPIKTTLGKTRGTKKTKTKQKNGGLPQCVSRAALQAPRAPPTAAHLVIT